MSAAESATPRATIFLAHSSLDIVQARRVRNLLEEAQHDVLLLKLSQAMAQDDLRDLLQREIQARDWLVILKSANADRSTWVDFESRFAKQHDKPVFVIDLEAAHGLTDAEALAQLTRQVEAISRRIRVFLSYARADRDIAKRLCDDLMARGFEVWFDVAELKAGDLWRDRLYGAIDRTLEQGSLVYLMTDAALSSAWVVEEVRHALAQRGRVIPCIVRHLLHEVPAELRAIQWIDFSAAYPAALEQLEHALHWQAESAAADRP